MRCWNTSSCKPDSKGSQREFVTPAPLEVLKPSSPSCAALGSLLQDVLTEQEGWMWWDPPLATPWAVRWPSGNVGSGGPGPGQGSRGFRAGSSGQPGPIMAPGRAIRAEGESWDGTGTGRHMVPRSTFQGHSRDDKVLPPWAAPWPPHGVQEHIPGSQ